MLYYPLEISDSLYSHPFWRPAEFSIVFSFWRVFGGRSFYRLKFLTTVFEPCKYLQNTSSIRNRVETAPEYDYKMAVCTQRSVRQSCKIYWCHSWPLTFSSNHISRWKNHLARERQEALNDMALLVSEISVFDKCHTTYCLACAHVYVCCDTTLVYIPQKVILVESRKWETTPKIPRLD